MFRSTRTLSLAIIVFALAALLAPAVYAAAMGVIANDSFESANPDAPSFAPWKLKNASGDRVACLDEAPGVQHGVCAFMFKGSAGENAKLVQKVANLETINESLVHTHGRFDLQFRYYSESSVTAFNSRVIVTYLIPGSDTPHVAKNNSFIVGKSLDNGIVTWVDRGLETMVQVPQGATILSAKYMFKNKSTAGKFYLDEVYGVYYIGD